MVVVRKDKSHKRSAYVTDQKIGYLTTRKKKKDWRYAFVNSQRIWTQLISIQEAESGSSPNVQKSPKDEATQESTTDKAKEPPRTSASAFASSGFASMANSTTSPFGAVGASKPSVFGGGSSTTSGFGGLIGSKSPQQGSISSSGGFGALGNSKPSSGFGFGGTSTSGFGGLGGGGSVFGSALSNGFGGSSGPKLSSFATGGTAAPPTAKPAKAFGAPDSDEEEQTDGDDDDEQAGSAEEDKRASSPEEKKRIKPQKGKLTVVNLYASPVLTFNRTSRGWRSR